MKQGRTLEELAGELTRQREAKRDFMAPSNQLTIREGESGKHRVEIGDMGEYPISDISHIHFSNYLEIPKKYYDRMRHSAPSLYAENVNHWLQRYPSSEKRLVRVLDGRCRALLSDRYRCLDNVDLAEAVLPVLGDLNVEIMSCEVTERRLYIKVVDKSVVKEIPLGHRLGDGSNKIVDSVFPALTITNSEIGFGRLGVDAGVYTQLCTNLCTFGESSMRKYHVGSKFGDLESATELLSDETKRLSDAALWSQVRDVVKGAFDVARFESHVHKLQVAAGRELEAPPQDVVEVTGKKFGLLEGERDSVLTHLSRGGNLSQYGLHAAVTRASSDLEDYDRATELERVGGKIIELSRKDWQRITTATGREG